MNTTTTTAVPCIPTEIKEKCGAKKSPDQWCMASLSSQKCDTEIAQKKTSKKKQTQFPFRP